MKVNILREALLYACFALCVSASADAMDDVEQGKGSCIGSSNECKSVSSAHERDSRLPPGIITLSGLPGSGKSTLARALLFVFDELGLKAAWHNQDEFSGDRDLFQSALSEMDGLDFLIVDRGNHDDKTRALAYDVRREFLRTREMASEDASHDFLISFPFVVTETLRARGMARLGHHTLAATDFDKVVDLFADLHKPVARSELVSRAQRIYLDVDLAISESLERCLHVILNSRFKERLTDFTIPEAIRISVMYEGIIADMNNLHLGFDCLPKKGRPSSIGIKINREYLGAIQNLFQAPAVSVELSAAASEVDSLEKTSFIPDHALDNKDFQSELYCIVKDTHGATDVKWFVEHWFDAKAMFGQTVTLSIQRIVWDTNAVVAILNLPESAGRFVSAASVQYLTLAKAPGLKASYVTQMLQSNPAHTGLSCLDLMSGPLILQGVFGAEYSVIPERQPYAKAGGRGDPPAGQKTTGGRGRGRSYDSAYARGGRGGARGYSGKGRGW